MFEEEFKKHISKFSTSPFLFIGSGFSRRYLGLPTWELLLMEICKELGLTKPYNFYKSNADSKLPKVASIIGEDFNEIWWSGEKFEVSRKQFSAIAETKYSPLKFEVAKKIQTQNELIKDEIIDKELKLLKKINIDGAITTNWDELLENIFPEFNKFVGQEELIFSELYSIGEIYKIHGCSSKPNSLILTEEDYNNYEDRNAYLAAKLLTIFIENPIIFIGYSLDDKNIQSILKSIIKCLTKEKIDKLKDRLIFCQWSPEPIQTSIIDSTLLISDTVIPIKLITTNNFIEIFTVLANNKRKLPIKILRQMKGMVYDFVKSNNSKSKIYVTDNLENIENIHNAEFVYGVGLKDKFSEVGIKGIELKDVLLDAIESRNWECDKISELCLPYLNAKYIPYFKHLRSASYLNDNNEIDEDNEIVEFSPEFIKKVNEVKPESFYPSANYIRKTKEINDKYSSFTELKSANNQLHILLYTPLLSFDKINLDELLNYLVDNKKLLDDSKNGTHFRKLICLYDYLKYKNNYS
ncbi:SIR2 family protein [Maribacter sp. M208]|uniref:SIR2 family protein n=1 Tax=Maribacter huludaoensis TaxID=3030010 RepID=UPI0023ED07A3|nr:SIR2 family protein [Maribacter huludaoensis]MDF4223017.1 SIR2 family protein [Maribacter huludaoensis]